MSLTAIDLLCERYQLEVTEVGSTPYATEPPRVTLQF